MCDKNITINKNLLFRLDKTIEFFKENIFHILNLKIESFLLVLIIFTICIIYFSSFRAILTIYYLYDYRDFINYCSIFIKSNN